MLFDLNSPSLAQYHWGTLFCSFSPAAPVDKDTFLKTIAALIAKAAPWTTDDELRATVALLHEIAHLAQDLTTGLGHSDYVTHRKETVSLLQYASIVIDTDGRSARPPLRQPGTPPWFDEKEDSFVAKAQGQLRYYPFEKTPSTRRDSIRGILTKDFNRPIPDEFLSDLSTQSLLESDAALTVLNHLNELHTTDVQRAIRERNTALYDRNSLGPEYWTAFVYLENVLVHHTDMDEDQARRWMPGLFGLFVDSALEYPPPAWILARSENPDDYDPTVKFARLLIAFQQLQGAEMTQFWNALAAKPADAEAILLSHSPFRYPSSEEILKAWVDALDPEVHTGIVAEIRRGACQYRLQHGVLMPRRDAALLFSMEAPILYLHKDRGFVKHDWGLRILDTQTNLKMTNEVLDHFMLMELGDFLFRSGEFRCPHAQADICPVVEDDCVSGFSNLAQFPESSRCVARSLLEKCGITFPTT